MRQGPSVRVLSGHCLLTNPSLEKTAEGPPRLPGKHLSGPETHPTPGHQTYDPGQELLADLPAIKKTMSARTAIRRYPLHLGNFICILQEFLLRTTVTTRLLFATWKGVPQIHEKHNQRKQDEPGSHLCSQNRMFSGNNPDTPRWIQPLNLNSM
jgi:hypothetical protein